MRHFEKNWLEWTVFGVGSALVLATVGYLTYAAATSNGEPAIVEVRLGEAEPRGSEFALPVTVTNRGNEAAETVLVEVLLTTRGGERERAELQIQLLPGGATRHGWVMFVSDPATATNLSARPVGFERP